MIASKPSTAIVTAVRSMTHDTTLFRLQAEEKAPLQAASFLPGQFLELSLPGVGEVPISYCGQPEEDGGIELCIRHVGHVTYPLHTIKLGDRLGVRGPFGVGFPLESYASKDLLLVAGGLGMAPLRSLLLVLLKQRQKFGRLTLLYGAGEMESLLFMEELQAVARRSEVQIHLSVDHPGYCLPGPPDCRTALLPDLLENLYLNPARTYAALCGPPVVYPLLVSALKRMGLADDRIHLSLERRMKCGQGRCGHCAVGTFFCCTDGPVFSHAQLLGIEGALI